MSVTSSDAGQQRDPWIPDKCFPLDLSGYSSEIQYLDDDAKMAFKRRIEVLNSHTSSVDKPVQDNWAANHDESGDSGTPSIAAASPPRLSLAATEGASSSSSLLRGSTSLSQMCIGSENSPTVFSVHPSSRSSQGEVFSTPVQDANQSRFSFYDNIHLYSFLQSKEAPGHHSWLIPSCTSVTPLETVTSHSFPGVQSSPLSPELYENDIANMHPTSSAAARSVEAVHRDNDSVWSLESNDAQEGDDAESDIVDLNESYTSPNSPVLNDTSDGCLTTQNMTVNPPSPSVRKHHSTHKHSLNSRSAAAAGRAAPAGTSAAAETTRQGLLTDAGLSGDTTSVTKRSLSQRRVRWHSFYGQNDSRESASTKTVSISHLSCGQMQWVTKACLLKLTCLVEVNRPSSWSWSLIKIFRRRYEHLRDLHVFGSSIQELLENTGSVIPHPIISAMDHLADRCIDTVGLFRKSGMRSRISDLEHAVEGQGEVSFEGQSPCDVADLIKVFFRKLPEPLMTGELARALVEIQRNIPVPQRLLALQLVMVLMPDENREALQLLFKFLNAISANSAINQMDLKNLTICFMPSLFRQFGAQSYTNEQGVKRARQSSGPTKKDLENSKYAQECLLAMASNYMQIFKVPEEIMAKSHFSSLELAEPVSLSELGKSSQHPGDDHMTYLETCICSVKLEKQRRFRGWYHHRKLKGIDISWKKVKDSYPLRLWKGSIDIQASSTTVLEKIISDGRTWDTKVTFWSVLDKPGPQTDVVYFVRRYHPSLASRDLVVVRSWTSDSETGTCIAVSTSVTHPNAPTSPVLVRGIVLADRYLVEKTGENQSRLTIMSRMDLKGRRSSYYKRFGPFMMVEKLTQLAQSLDPKSQTLALGS